MLKRLLLQNLRARRATQELIRLAGKSETVLLVGHGLINHYIAKELLNLGWIGPEKAASGYWAFSVYHTEDYKL